MFEPRNHEDNNLFILRWAARVLGAACLAFLLLFIFGEDSNWSNITAKQFVGLLFFPGGLIIGLILAWRRELLGGAISAGSVLALYIIYGWFLNGSLGQGWWFIVFAIPGVLFFACGILSMNGQTAAGDKIRT